MGWGGIVNQLAGIFLHVDAGDADAFGTAVHIDVQVALDGDGQFVLGYLVSLGQVGIEVVFAGKPAVRRNGAVGGQGHAQGVVHDLAVEYRQHPGHAQADRADMGVGGGAELGGAAAEDFGGGFQLGMDFQSDDGFELHGVFRSSSFLFTTKNTELSEERGDTQLCALCVLCGNFVTLTLMKS